MGYTENQDIFLSCLDKHTLGFIRLDSEFSDAPHRMDSFIFSKKIRFFLLKMMAKDSARVGGGDWYFGHAQTSLY